MKRTILFILLTFNLAIADDLKLACSKEYKAISNANQSQYETLKLNRWKKFSKRCDYKVFDTSDKSLQDYANNSKEYTGHEGMKNAHLTQKELGLGSLQKFRKWANNSQWQDFGPTNHFDWWMFPIGDESSQGYKYTVLAKDIKVLKEDSRYLSDYREGLRLMFKSWGWDLEKAIVLKNKSTKQSWRYYDVRLRKTLQSMHLFNQKKYLKSAKKFVDLLIHSDQIENSSQVLIFLNSI